MGALIVFERDADLVDFVDEPGVEMDAKVTEELLVSLFLPDSENKLHDGAVHHQEPAHRRRPARCCRCPRNAELDKALGTRHRAAIGITEETDAVVVVVSRGARRDLAVLRRQHRPRPRRRHAAQGAAGPVPEGEAKRAAPREAPGRRRASPTAVASLPSSAAAGAGRRGRRRATRSARRQLATPATQAKPARAAARRGAAGGTAEPAGRSSDVPASCARAFLDELPLKVVSMVLAMTLFVLVRSDKDASRAAPTSKVVYTLPEDRVLVSEPLDGGAGGVRGPWTRAAALRRPRLEPIHVDLDARQPTAMLHFDETMVKLPVGPAGGVDHARRRSDVEFEQRVEKRCRCSRSSRASRRRAFSVTRVDGAARPRCTRRRRQERGRGAAAACPARPLRVVGARARRCAASVALGVAAAARPLPRCRPR